MRLSREQCASRTNGQHEPTLTPSGRVVCLWCEQDMRPDEQDPGTQ